jgi:hypothetical protein
MRKPLLLAALALPLLGFDCGGGTSTPPSPFHCTLQVRGAVISEDLWCIVTAYDYAPMGQPEWAFELVAYRGAVPTSQSSPLPDVAAGVGVFLPAAPQLGKTYAWTTATSDFSAGGAERYEGSAQAGTTVQTHEAHAPLAAGDTGTGAASIRFTAIPAAGATGADVTAVHGTVDGTLEPLVAGGGPITIHAVF